MTKQEKRQKIMELLKWYKELEEQDIKTANYIISKGGTPDEVLSNRVKFGRYFPIKDLHETIANAMEIKEVDWRGHENELDGIHDVAYGRKKFNRHYRIEYKMVGYFKADFKIIQMVVDRMAEQGYIRVSKTGKGFRVLKVN